MIVIQPGTQEGAVALEHPESTRTMTPLAAMAATSRTRTRPSSRYCGEPKLTLVKLDYEFHLEMWPDCCFQLALILLNSLQLRSMPRINTLNVR